MQRKRGYALRVRRKRRRASSSRHQLPLLRSPPHDGPSSLLPDHRDLLSQQAAGAALAVRGDRRRRAGALSPADGLRRALPDGHGRALGQRREGGQRRGVEPRDLVDPWAVNWRAAFDKFEISYDRFIRTTDDDHARASTEMVRRAMAAGDIYKGTYSGWYCPGDNEFKTEAQLVDGHCPDHPTLELQWLEEENWFFALSKYQERLEQLYRGSALVLRARALPQRGPGLAQGGPARLLDQPRRHELGHPVSGRSRPPHLRLVRRADQLHHGRRLPRRSWTHSPTGGRPTCTSSARTSRASIACTGRRC